MAVKVVRKRKLTRPLITCVACGYRKEETVRKPHKKHFVGKCACPDCGEVADKYLYVDECNLPDKS